ncbi:hypothetical protein ACYATM_00290 [Lactobacillaceae bacterium Scapto_B20]
MNLKKRLLVSTLAASLLAPTALATFENTTGNTITASAAKAKHHKKVKKAKKAKKAAKKKTTKQAPITNQTNTQPTQTTTPQNTDQQTYNNAVGSLGKYANPSNMTSFTVGTGTRFNLGGNQDYVNSLNDITNNMGSSDAYDAQMYGNSAILEFQQQALQLYQGFRGRFSSYDNDTLTSASTAVQQNWVSASSSSDSVNSQWNNVKILLNDLSNAFSKL